MPRLTSPPPVELHGVSYRVGITSAGGASALLCEAPLGAPLPEYLLRRELFRRLQPLAPSLPRLFTDAPRSAWVLAWTARLPGRVSAYRERSLAPADLEAELSGWRPAPGGEDAAPPSATSPEALVCGTLLRRAARRHPPLLRDHLPLPEPPGATELPRVLREAVEASDQPDGVRAVWRAARQMRVLDPACGDGEWLLGAMRALEVAYHACLERMQAWVDDLGRSRTPSRPERLRDFRAALAAVDDTTRWPTRAQSVRALILLDNLHGADRDAAAAGRCRARLLACTGAAPGPAEAHREAACAVHAGDPACGIGSRAELERALAGVPGGAWAARELAEEAEVLGSAERALRGALLASQRPEPLTEGVCRVRNRRSALDAALDCAALRLAGMSPRDAGACSEWLRHRRPLHPLSAFGGAAARGGFHLVRGSAR